MLAEDKRLLLVELSRSAQGEALRELIAEAKVELGDVTKCNSWEDTLGRKHAMEFLSKTFSFLDKGETKSQAKSQYV